MFKECLNAARRDPLFSSGIGIHPQSNAGTVKSRTLFQVDTGELNGQSQSGDIPAWKPCDNPCLDVVTEPDGLR